jgi:hypothetical protein
MATEVFRSRPRQPAPFCGTRAKPKSKIGNIVCVYTHGFRAPAKLFLARRLNDAVLFFYFDEYQPAEGVFTLPEGNSYASESIDVVKLPRTPLPGVHSSQAELKLPGAPWSSLWFREKGIV